MILLKTQRNLPPSQLKVSNNLHPNHKLTTGRSGLMQYNTKPNNSSL